MACDLADEPSVVPSLIPYREALQLLLGAVVRIRSDKYIAITEIEVYGSQ